MKSTPAKSILRVSTFLFFASVAVGAPRDDLWKKVDAATNSKLPRTAIELLDQIYPAALSDHTYAEASKALFEKIALEATIRDSDPGIVVDGLSAQLPSAPEPMKPVIEAFLAKAFAAYYGQHMPEYWSRQPIAGSEGRDFRTWSQARIISEVDNHYAAALAYAPELKKVPVGDWTALMPKGTAEDNLRPTLFDIIAYDALEFYSGGGSQVSAYPGAFVVDGSGPILGNSTDFIAWKPSQPAAYSPVFKSIRIYQELLEFHRNDPDRSAFFEADLSRIRYAGNLPDIGRASAYQAALWGFAKENTQYPASCEAFDLLAEIPNQGGNFVEAHRIAKLGLASHVGSDGEVACQNLMFNIEQKYLYVRTSGVWCAQKRTIDVTYRNITKVYFRAIKVDFNWAIERGFGNASEAALDDPSLLGKPSLEWSADLPATSDYKQRTEHVLVTGPLERGFYVVFASGDSKFSGSNNGLCAAPVWVTNLALVLNVSSPSTKEGFVVDPVSGGPVAGAKVDFWDTTATGSLKPSTSTVSDENGRFEFERYDKEPLIVASKNGNAVSNAPLNGFFNRLPKNQGRQVQFFTDRNIYRPGQAIKFTGIAISFDTLRGSYSPESGRKFTVILNDPQGKEAGRLECVSNDYGSFTGVFTAPPKGLNGQMWLTSPGCQGEIRVRLEEYKRPKFDVEIAPPEDAPALGQRVTVKGKTVAYSGSPVDGAIVKWAVRRGLSYPVWFMWNHEESDDSVSEGISRTSADGSFEISFIANAKSGARAEDQPRFDFSISADVTDSTGETQSGSRSVLLGYTSLVAVLSADEWQTAENPVDITLSLTTLDGEPRLGTGIVQIDELVRPDDVAKGTPEDQDMQDPDGQDSGSNELPEFPALRLWHAGKTMASEPITADATGSATLSVRLPAGFYRATFKGKDPQGNEVRSESTVQVVDPHSDRFAAHIPSWLGAPTWSVEAGNTFTALWGTGYPSGRALIEILRDDVVLKRYWTQPGRSQELIAYPVDKSLCGGFALNVFFVRENHLYRFSRTVDVPWSSKKLSVHWEHFRSKIEPGARETWTAVVRGPDAKKVRSEMVATLYDASLDQLLTNQWPEMFGVFRQNMNFGFFNYSGENDATSEISEWSQQRLAENSSRYRALIDPQLESIFEVPLVLSPFFVDAAEDAGSYRAMSTLAGTRIRTDVGGLPPQSSIVTAQYLSKTSTGMAGRLDRVASRRDLSETAFFYPQLESDRNGEFRVTFTMPDSLTTWRFLGFAHDKALRSGLLSGETVTQKDLMVQPNVPRFLREGDDVALTVKVSNMTDHSVTGSARMSFADAATERPMDTKLGNRAMDMSFSLEPHSSKALSWRIAIPDGTGFIKYKAVAVTGDASDGEEAVIPVLSRKSVVTESVPVAMRGPSSRTVRLEKLAESPASMTLCNESLTVEMTSNPAWYAVMSLPYLMEFPHECSEQLFDRLYANLLSLHVANSSPEIRKTFDLWKNAPAFESPLSKNADLKSIMIEETPWLRDATDESQARRNVGELFDANRIESEIAAIQKQLADRQLTNGLWPWFPGEPGSEYISLYMVAGFGRLRRLGVNVDVSIALKSLAGIGSAMQIRCDAILRSKAAGTYVPSNEDIHYLYGRSFFLRDASPTVGEKRVLDFYLDRAKKAWPQVDSIASQAELAVALLRFGDAETAEGILRSLRERSLTDEVSGMYWEQSGWAGYWYDSPIEAQTQMIEAFDEVGHDAKAVGDCKVWLLERKKAEDWGTTTATADAVFALLLRSDNLLAQTSDIKLSIGGSAVVPDKVEAGTGYFEQRLVGSQITPSKADVVIQKAGNGLSLGAVHWQYLEDLSKITEHAGSPISISKSLFTREATPNGLVLRPVDRPVSVGDEIFVRLEIRAGRDLEFVHIEDQRGSGTEPVAVLSQYHYEGGLGYYESTRDTATHFFFDKIPQGTYVLEYSVRVQLRGSYQSGIAKAECMYAPEFNSHSRSMMIEAK